MSRALPSVSAASDPDVELENSGSPTYGLHLFRRLSPAPAALPR